MVHFPTEDQIIASTPAIFTRPAVEINHLSIIPASKADH